ncbi:hypothetical protein [Streptomyces sp. NPDC096311]|uniref:hypothetical protein n=1 Tax=Streptomyces sp. NPDC096311 TaxID=3366083 RepID=UPI0038028BBE
MTAEAHSHGVDEMCEAGRTLHERALRNGGVLTHEAVHIAELTATPGSESRARLGYLIGRSGILDQDH